MLHQGGLPLLDPSQIIVPLLNYSGQSLTEKEEVFFEPYQLEHFSVEFSRSGFSSIIRELRKGNFDDLNWHRLAQLADQLSLTQGFSELLCVEHLAQHWQQGGVIPYPHQIKTVERVIKEMRGLAILADEVGLGKTIEAGMILKEYLLRGLVKRALILTPASLCWQWYQELAEKFQIYAGIQRSEWDWEHADILIASIDTAKMEPHAEIIRNINYDMVIVDEAHKLKNTATKAWQLVNSLEKKYCLMLTATPVQNNLKELYNLITLLKPGHLGSYRTFKQKFMQDLRTPKNPGQLRQLLSEVLIRNRRGEGTVKFTKRNVYPIIVELTPPERALYDQITELIRASSTLAPFKANILPLITLQREVCSSFYAAGITLQKIYEKHGMDPDGKIMAMMNDAVRIRQNSKCDIIEKLVSQIQDRVIIFTEYKASQEYIRYRLEKANFRTLAFDGSLSAAASSGFAISFKKKAVSW